MRRVLSNIFHSMRKGLVAVAMGLLLCMSGWGHAATLQLDISGRISRHTDQAGKLYHLSEADILAMPAHQITTSTSWTDKSVFRGISLSDLLERVGANGTSLRVTAYDGYISYAIPVSDARRYGVILAYSRNGTKLELKDFGPLFIVYPRDQYSDELNNSVTESKFIWQVKSIEVR